MSSTGSPQTGVQETSTPYNERRYYTAPSSQQSQDSMDYATAQATRASASSTQDLGVPVASSTQKRTTAEPPPADPQIALATAITQAMSKAVSQSLQPLLATKEPKNKPNKYRGEKDGLVDSWLMIMRRYLDKAHVNDSPADKAWTIIEFLESDARNYVINKSEPERDTDDKVMDLLARRFGVGSNRNMIRGQFQSRCQKQRISGRLRRLSLKNA